MNRRAFLTAAGSAYVAAAFAQPPVQKGAQPATPVPPAAPVAPVPRVNKRIKLGISTYSYWNVDGKRLTIEACIERAGALGVECVDILHRQMELDERVPMDAAGRAYCRKLKRLAFRNGMAVACLSTHQNFVTPDAKARQQNVEHTQRCLDVADALGAGCMRVNTGRWGTIKTFEEYMEKRGLEPPLADHTDDEAFDRSEDVV